MGKIKWVCILLLLTSKSIQSQINANSVIQEKIDSIHKTNKIPGILIATSIKGKHQFFTSGSANKKNNQSFSKDTQFEIGSITKTFTAFILESVLQSKNIADTSSIFRFLPDSLRTNTALQSFQFIQLLNHTSGLPRLPDNMGTPVNFLQPYASYKKEDLYAFLSSYEVKPSNSVIYSNLGVGLAGVLAENISGSNYEHLLNKYINKPFGLKNTGVSLANKRPKATGYFNNQEALYWDMNVLVGAGGIKSDAKDILNYLDFIAKHQSTPIINSILQKSSKVNNQISVAKAWHTIEKNNQTFLYWHNGGTYGFSTFCAFNPINHNSILIVINAFNQNSIADGLGIEIMTSILN